MPVSLVNASSTVGVDIVRPVVEIDDTLGCGGCAASRGGSEARTARANKSGEPAERQIIHVSVGSPAAFHAKIPPARCEP